MKTPYSGRNVELYTTIFFVFCQEKTKHTLFRMCFVNWPMMWFISQSALLRSPPWTIDEVWTGPVRRVSPEQRAPVLLRNLLRDPRLDPREYRE
jgi:hypothetical protein